MPSTNSSSVQPNPNSASSRPSDARRMRLKQMDAQNVSLSTARISNVVPIERYYEIANKLLNQFHNSYSQNRLDEAYIFGLRFATFSTQILTSHDYYKIPHLTALREKNIQDAAQTINLLEDVVQLMDEEEEEWETRDESKFDQDDVPSLSSSSISSAIFPPSSEQRIPIQTLTEMYTEDYLSFVQSHRIQYTYLSTYQGKKTSSGKDSTNGCTVISSLVVAYHLASNEESSLSTDDIQSIMDDIAPDLLIHVRSKLGLGSNALIIPSDVHDYLLELQILQQEQFVGVVGGDILEEDHLQKLIQVFKDQEEEEEGYENHNTTTMNPEIESKKEDGIQTFQKKMAMSFFFHEHVMSILKVKDENGLIRYDWIDSMPHSTPDGGLGAIRIQCIDLKALEVLLRWYACDTFTEKDQAWINQQDWDESLCDTDPRVFQAYIWKQV